VYRNDKGVLINATEIMIYSADDDDDDDGERTSVEIVRTSLAFNNVPVRQYNNDRRRA